VVCSFLSWFRSGNFGLRTVLTASLASGFCELVCAQLPAASYTLFDFRLIPNRLHLAVLFPGFTWEFWLHHLYHNNVIGVPYKCLWRYFLPHDFIILFLWDKRACTCRRPSLFCIIDPTYMILVVLSNASDNVYCIIICLVTITCYSNIDHILAAWTVLLLTLICFVILLCNTDIYCSDN
jgi:hypothetical protein